MGKRTGVKEKQKTKTYGKILNFSDNEGSAPIKQAKEKKKICASHITERTVDCYGLSGQSRNKQHAESEPSCDPRTPPLLGTHPKVHRDVCKGLIFTAALFAIVKH